MGVRRLMINGFSNGVTVTLRPLIATQTFCLTGTVGALERQEQLSNGTVRLRAEHHLPS